MRPPIDFSFKPHDIDHSIRIAQAAGNQRDLVRLQYQHELDAEGDARWKKASPEELEELEEEEEKFKAWQKEWDKARERGEFDQTEETIEVCCRAPVLHTTPPEPGRPLWLPPDADLESLPPDVRQALDEIVRPAYEELVLQAANSLERQLGASLVHFLWLEILDQADIKADYTLYVLRSRLKGNRTLAINQYLKLTHAKLRYTQFLTRLQDRRKTSPLPSAGTTQWSGPGVRAEAVKPVASSTSPSPAPIVVPPSGPQSAPVPFVVPPSGGQSDAHPTKAETPSHPAAIPSNISPRNPFATLLSHPTTDAERAQLRKALRRTGVWKNGERALKNPSSETHDPTPTNPEEPHSWRNQEPLTKTETPSNQDLKPKTQAPSWKNEETLSKTEIPNGQGLKPKTQDPSWKNEKMLSKTETSSNQDPEKTQDPSWKNQDPAPKTPPAEPPTPAQTFAASLSDDQRIMATCIVETMQNHMISGEPQDSEPKASDLELWKNGERALKNLRE